MDIAQLKVTSMLPLHCDLFIAVILWIEASPHTALVDAWLSNGLRLRTSIKKTSFGKSGGDAAKGKLHSPKTTTLHVHNSVPNWSLQSQHSLDATYGLCTGVCLCCKSRVVPCLSHIVPKLQMRHALIPAVVCRFSSLFVAFATEALANLTSLKDESEP